MIRFAKNNGPSAFCMIAFAMVLSSAPAHSQNALDKLQIDRNPEPFYIPMPEQKRSSNTTPQADETEPKDLPISRVENDSDLPRAVRDLKAALINAARSGDVEKLRPFIELGDDGTQLSINSEYAEPIDFLKESSSDGEALETLAILIDILSLRAAHYGLGSEDEAYIWPYFWGSSLDKLTPREKVEMFQILTFGDFVAMEESNSYFFYRIGISPEGKLLFFVTGD